MTSTSEETSVAAATTTATKATTTGSTATTASSTNYLFLLCCTIIVLLWISSQYILIPYVVHLLALVTCILYVACHGSLLLLIDDPPIIVQDEDGNETMLPINSERETLRASDAYQFPIIGSISLFSLYCAFKYLDKDLVNLLIGGYFGMIGTVAVTMTLSPLLIAITPKPISNLLCSDIKWEHKIHHSFNTMKWLGSPLSPLDFTIIFCFMEIIAAVLSICIIAFYYYYSKPWYINNILGISFCIQGIQRFSLGTYKIGAILLVGLFFYDIFWVFGTDVMVTVAKNLDGPIKILLPRTLERHETTGNFKDLSLLGLGDIVIPGFFLALLLRFDAHRYMSKIDNETATNATQTGTTDAVASPNEKYVVTVHDNFPKPYFHFALISYVGGLGFTIFIMIYFNAAQPALLYLVPACLGSSLFMALIRGEIKDLFEYSEEVDDIIEVENANESEITTTGESKKEQ